MLSKSGMQEMANSMGSPSGYDLFSVDENFLTDLSTEDESMITGGGGKSSKCGKSSKKSKKSKSSKSKSSKGGCYPKYCH
jgi:hypothetical protein